MTDRDRLLLLLDAVPDYTFQPETATGKMLRRSTLRGPAPHHKGPCPTCNGVGRVQRKDGDARPCNECANPVYRGRINCGSCGARMTGSVLREGVEHLGRCARRPAPSVAAVEGFVRTWCRAPREWGGNYDLEIGWMRVSSLRRRLPMHDCACCDVCKGRGKVDYDGYTNRPVTTSESSPEARTDADVRERKARDRARIDALLGAADDPPLDVDAFTAYVDRMGAPAMGSIPQVIRLLDELRLRNHLVYRMVVSVHVLHLRSEAKMHRALRRRLDCGVRFLERSLTKPVRVPRELLERERIRSSRTPSHRLAAVKGKGDAQLPTRDREIRKLAEQGESVASIAAAFRLSRRQVQRVLQGGDGANGGSVAA